ncbi:methylornithine synthase PylB [Desulfosporosinus metallidurans]|uniref:Proline 2-methylase for pyrrolysine biosynthesis n=1 Tax=Desulfosporosinus metallidurans TaxID=1888891 RepID=A0A1Q8QIU5_9FIRM|nr:methylornithine synthase PylB [Desulfosporosinus metallidurans]OLN27269.1 Proline 2-methylase for pyrrolysine biosynthesis [Desulfosporosinus metallidurans]
MKKEGDFVALDLAPTNLDRILEKAIQEIPLVREELLFLLRLSEENDLSKVFEAARFLRTRYFKDRVFIYGFVYFSTHCRNDCAFCLYRRSNHSLERYRKTDSEIMETALSLVESGVHLLDLTMGEDPLYFETGFEPLVKTVEAIKENTNIPIMISTGVVSEEVLGRFKKAGADWYACYQETHTPDLYRKLRRGQSYDERMERKRAARKMGFLIEEGLLTGVGDTDEDLVNSLEEMKSLEADQIRVMSFVPQKDTPMQDFPTIPRLRELLLIAVMRLVFPDRLIPASLDVDGLNGLAERLNSGANVVTSIIPPQSGLAGVSNHSLDIADGNRTVGKIIPLLKQSGLVPATRYDYAEWIQRRQ